MAAIISIEEYKRIQREREEDFGVFDDIWEKNKSFSSSQIEQDIADTLQEVRKNRKRKL
ncbi:MAG: hypothetical protein HYU64_16820 [Armatimonadetes bacterium]|nr:hypothetical protein [Armatimonadota bacterium]